MKATFEHSGTIIDIGSGLVFGERDTNGNFGGAHSPNTIGVAVYQRDLADPSQIAYKVGFSMKPSEARAMASAILSSATESKA